MRRRHRGHKEIPFSFDSFLDIVANVVGIILKLILVAWVGAKSYKAVMPKPPPLPEVVEEVPTLPEPTDPRTEQFTFLRASIAEQQGRAEEQTVRERQVQDVADELRRDLEALQSREHALTAEQKETRRQNKQQSRKAQQANLSLEELHSRSKKLLDQIDELRKLPVARKELRYRTPVSSPLQTEEAMFECRHGRVTLLDTAALLTEVKREARSKAEGLKSQWQVTATTSAVGAFRLRYVLERERSLFDGPMRAVPADDSFRYALVGWEAVPALEERGESVEQALAEGSRFRQVLARLDPEQTAVTFWVYPDSFAVYRALRDYLHAKNLVVAGRPLPEGAPIASSRQGSHSRGQ